MKKIIITLILVLTVSGAYTQNTYIFVEVKGDAMVYGKNQRFGYMTTISELNCSPSNSQIISQAYSLWDSIVNDWDTYKHKVWHFNSESEAQNTKQKLIDIYNRYDWRLGDRNIGFYYECN